jgi:hypothetical protein
MEPKKSSSCRSEKVAPDRHDDRQPATTLTRTEVAAALGVSPSTVRRLEGSEIHPIVLADGKHVFDPAEVRAVVESRATRSAGPATGELTARACELFREGKGSIDVIIALRQPFDVVLEWQRKYVAESGSLLVPEALATRLKEAFFVEGEPFTAEGLWNLLERLTRRNVELTRRVRAPSTL